MTDVNELVDRDRIQAARAAHQAAIAAEVSAAAYADQKHLAAASAKRAADAALLGTPAEVEAAQSKAETAERAAQLASRVAVARTAARVASEAVMAEAVKQAHAAAVRDAIVRRVGAVRKAADLVRAMAETAAEYSAADRDLQTCQTGGVSYPLEMRIGVGMLDGNGKPIAVALHEAYLKGCGVNVETGQMRWMQE